MRDCDKKLNWRKASTSPGLPYSLLSTSAGDKSACVRLCVCDRDSVPQLSFIINFLLSGLEYIQREWKRIELGGCSFHPPTPPLSQPARATWSEPQQQFVLKQERTPDARAHIQNGLHGTLPQHHHHHHPPPPPRWMEGW